MKEIELNELISKHYDIEVSSIEKLREGGSSTYFVRTQDQKYILKFTPEAFKNTMKDSLDILQYLEKNNFPSPRVVLTRKGLKYFTYSETINKSFAALYHYTEGRALQENEDFMKIGMIVGQLHKLMENYPGSLKENRKEFFIERYINILKEKEYNKTNIIKFRDYGDYLWKKVKDLPKGYCHGDLHKGNLIKDINGEYHLLDFDTSCNAFPIYDIMLICNSTDYFTYDEKAFELTKRRYESFLEGYQKYKRLNKREVKAFYDLIAIYHYQLQATIIEIYGLDCVDDVFLDNQLDWLMKWKRQCEKNFK